MIEMKGKCAFLANFFLLQKRRRLQQVNLKENNCWNCLPRSGFVQQELFWYCCAYRGGNARKNDARVVVSVMLYVVG